MNLGPGVDFPLRDSLGCPSFHAKTIVVKASKGSKSGEKLGWSIDLVEHGQQEAVAHLARAPNS